MFLTHEPAFTISRTFGSTSITCTKLAFLTRDGLIQDINTRFWLVTSSTWDPLPSTGSELRSTIWSRSLCMDSSSGCMSAFSTKIVLPLRNLPRSWITPRTWTRKIALIVAPKSLSPLELRSRYQASGRCYLRAWMWRALCHFCLITLRVWIPIANT